MWSRGDGEVADTGMADHACLRREFAAFWVSVSSHISTSFISSHFSVSCPELVCWEGVVSPTRKAPCVSGRVVRTCLAWKFPILVSTGVPDLESCPPVGKTWFRSPTLMAQCKPGQPNSNPCCTLKRRRSFKGIWLTPLRFIKSRSAHEPL